MSESKYPVTFGVEIEFVVKDVGGVVDASLIPTVIRQDLSQEDKDSLWEGNNWRQFAGHIAEILRDNGISNVTTDSDQATFFTDWYVKRDTSVKGPIGSGHYYGLEIVSPILTLGYNEVKDIEKVCKTITKNYELSVNETCGLHVHVGKGRQSVPSDKEVKNLYAILWTFEKRLDQLHPFHRRDHIQCRSMHSCSPLALECLSPRKSLDEILKCQSKLQVLDLFLAPEDDMAYEGYNLSEDSGERIKRTVEFRQHEGTLDPEAITNWATVCARLLQYAGEVPQADLEAFLWDNAKDEQTFTAVDLIEKIGLKEEAQYYRSRMN